MSLLEYIPRELLCQTFNYVLDIDTLTTFMTISDDISNLAKNTITRLCSKDIVYLPLHKVINLPKLREIDNKILITGNFEMISTLTELSNGVFYVEECDIYQLGEVIVSILKSLKSKNPKIKILSKYNDKNVGFILQDGTYIIYHPGDVSYIIKLLRNYNQKLIYISCRMNFVSSCWLKLNNVRYHMVWTPYNIFMRNNVKFFLLNNDFGLVYPNQPPSNGNIPLSIYAKLVARVGLDLYYDNITEKFLRIMFHHYKNYQHILDYFRPNKDVLDQIMYDYEIKSCDLTFPCNIWSIIYEEGFICNNRNKIEGILEIELNINYDCDFLEKIPDILDKTLDIYKQSQTYYATNGEVKSVNHYQNF